MGDKNDDLTHGNTVAHYFHLIYVSLTPFAVMEPTERSLLNDAREQFVKLCKANRTLGVHCVTFQPDPSRINEDRYVVEQWNSSGKVWMFLAVCDGFNFGPYTNDLT